MKKIFFALMAAAALLSVACNKTSEIEVMSYNIRYLNDHDGENHWDKRKHASITMINEERPTVFGTQEGVWEQISYFIENLPEYGHAGIGQDDGKLDGEFMSHLPAIGSGRRWSSRLHGRARVCQYPNGRGNAHPR